MSYIIGFIIGILFSTLVIATLAFFRSAIERRMIVIERKMMDAGPQPRGFIVEPTDEGDEIRAGIIERNRKLGRDTHVSELL